MKIMVVAPYYAPQVGGLENYALNVVQALIAQGHEVVVVTSGTGNSPGVIRLRAWLKASNTPVNPLWYWQLKRLVGRERPDVVMAHTPVPFIADLAARAAGSTPFVLIYHNDLAKDSGVQKAIVAAYWRLLGHGTLERADRIVTTSERYATTSSFLKQYSAKVDVIAPGVDTRRFHPQVDTSAVSQPDRQVVLFVGSLHRSHAHKGLDLLMRAVAELHAENPRVQLVVVGRGDGLPEYRSQAANLGLDVTFTGFVADEDLPAYYAAADVFVLPSTNMAEGFGMVLLEASACGTPVIGTNVGGIPAALQTVGSSNLAEPRVDSIAQQLRKVLASDEKPAPVTSTWDDAARRTEQSLLAARRPRIALIHNMIAPYRLALFRELAAEVNLRVFFTQGAGKDRLWQASVDGNSFDARVLPSAMLGPVALNPGGFRRLRRSRFDALITNTDPDTAPLSLAGLLLARLRRRPVVVWSEVTDDVVRSVPLPVPGLARLVRGYRRLFLNRATVVLAFSEAARTYLSDFAGKVVRTHQVVPPELLPPAQEQPSRDGRTFLYVGYLTDRKNVDLLIRAFQELTDPRARLLIAGSGPRENALKLRAGSDTRISFLGYVDGQRKAELFSASDVLVLPTRHDCWGLVVNEAIHYGLAVIVTAAAGASELIDDARGVVVPSEDQAALTAAMAGLIADPAALRAVQNKNLNSPDVSDVRSAVRAMSQAVRQALA
ncbi:glycosyltransferase family 4 protein [Kineosporia babensis]|uniref:Glycosyltransferase family 4 protein n=1 Tax=Kineosporia babensis TaxID=499548 RepID=A0A9X1SU35_9ACTN|nr:glycosyltransferase family 4 protein [Kineosporia babensis]MCD5311290.1 glycosyltransferase family 4 protein [Kineosporia babensis]